MQQGGDYTASYYYPHHQNPNPSPNDLIPSSYASAPPFSHYPPTIVATTTATPTPTPHPSDPYSSPFPPFSQNPDPISSLPPSAPSYSQPTYSPFAPATAAPDYPPHLQQPPPAPYYPFDPQPTPANYPAANPSFSAPYDAPPSSYSAPPPPAVYENPPYDGNSAFKYDRSGGGGYLDENSGSYGYSRSSSYPGAHRNDGLEEGVYAYDGGRVEPYGARGTGGTKSSSSSSGWSGFDDYGRSLSFGKEQQVGSGKIVRAVPKADVQQDVKNGVQKYRVKLLPESSGQSTMDVLCQIGLDGIRMLDPSTNRTLRIYPLENVTRWEVNDPSVYTFWAKSPVDIDPRRIRLQSNSYTTSTILDTVTAATVQLKEMGGTKCRVAPDAGKQPEQLAEKKKAFSDWMNLIKPVNEEKDHWVPDEAVSKCTSCGTDFGAFVRKHHCRNCGDIFCDKCTHGRIALNADENAQVVRVCDRCLGEVSQRLSNAKESSNRTAAQQSHEDLARKLQEEMERNRKASSAGTKSEALGRRMKEVACPICTVHLQVQVPASGSETIECGVCQNPFLVSAH